MTADMFAFQPSPQQAAFLDFAASGQGNAVLEACAGSGKTSTLTHGVSRMRGTKFLGAFNKSIAAELQKRVRSDDPASRSYKILMKHKGRYVTLKPCKRANRIPTSN